MSTGVPDRPVAVTVVCSDPADEPPELSARLGAEADVRLVFDTQQLRDALPTSDVAFVWDFRSTRLREAWSPASRVRWVHVASAGVEPLLFPEMRDQPVVLTNSRGVFDGAIAEFVLAALLALAKDLPESLRLQREHVWKHRETRLVAGATVLVIGAGSIGRAVARLVGAVGCRVVGAARTAREDDCFDRVVPISDLGPELRHADFVVVTAPLTEQTSGLLGAQAFARMKPGAVLINVGRGPIVDESALLEALDRGQLRAAVLDVFGEEPLPAEHPFWDRPDVLVSPHMCGDFEGFTEVLVDLFVENFGRMRSGRQLQNVVDKHRGY
jgi:phosphoglycerate dehydrogenase-like enzyme